MSTLYGRWYPVVDLMLQTKKLCHLLFSIRWFQEFAPLQLFDRLMDGENGPQVPN